MMMGATEQQQHRLHQSHQLYHNLTKKALREIDIPPRKLLSRRSAADAYMDSPKVDDAVFSKFLPYNNVEDDDDDPYSSDHFRMYEFKVRKCNRSRSHDWTDCPFAHPGEKARRRDPRRFHYSGTVCSEFRKGHCSKGDNCEFSHGVFECWLHPSRYRTEACKDGKNCKRKVCFFAHSTRQLRMLPETSSPPMNSPTSGAENVRYQPHHQNHCCVLCHSCITSTASPTSTLMGIHAAGHVSPPTSPPISPYGDHRFGSMQSYGRSLDSSCGMLSPERFINSGGMMNYKDAVTDLMASFEAMNVIEANSSPSYTRGTGGNNNGKLGWLDVNSSDEQPQFVLSPSTPTPTPAPWSRGASKFASGESKFGDYPAGTGNLMELDSSSSRYSNVAEGGNLAGPDFGWVNDLLT